MEFKSELVNLITRHADMGRIVSKRLERLELAAAMVDINGDSLNAMVLFVQGGPATRMDKIILTVGNRAVEAEVTVSSPNRKSLIVSFDAALDGCIGAMPIYIDDDGRARNLITGNPVAVKWVSE